MYEHYILKRSQYYDPELDRQQKVEELRKRYEDSVASDEDEDGEIKAAQGELPESVHKYFHMERELGLSPTQSKVNLSSDEKALEVS